MELIKYPNEFLDKKVKPFDWENLDSEKIEQEMISIMMNSDGIGLAANQVSLDARVFTIFPKRTKGITKPFAVIDPTIEQISLNKIEDVEGCLSFPKLWIKVRRPEKVTVKFLDSKQKECIMEFSGYDARCFLHEYDHLEGITFVNPARVSKLRLDMALKKQKKAVKELEHGRA